MARERFRFNDPTDGDQRDDMYSLTRGGFRVNASGLPRLGKPDRPHIFADGKGNILPATKIRSKKNIPGISGRTFKIGTPHSHDINHRNHFLEDASLEKDLLRRFRRSSQFYRRQRQCQE